jgi:hypothetical protein
MICNPPLPRFYQPTLDEPVPWVRVRTDEGQSPKFRHASPISLISALLCGISHPGGGGSSLLAGRPHAKTKGWAA